MQGQHALITKTCDECKTFQRAATHLLFENSEAGGQICAYISGGCSIMKQFNIGRPVFTDIDLTQSCFDGGCLTVTCHSGTGPGRSSWHLPLKYWARQEFMTPATQVLSQAGVHDTCYSDPGAGRTSWDLPLRNWGRQELMTPAIQVQGQTDSSWCTQIKGQAGSSWHLPLRYRGRQEFKTPATQIVGQAGRRSWHLPLRYRGRKEFMTPAQVDRYCGM